MWIQRYMIVDHDEEDDNIKFADEYGNAIDIKPLAKTSYIERNGIKILQIHGGHLTAQIINRPVIHDHVGGYHTIRINPKQIMVVADMRPEKTFHLDSHEKVSLLPSLHSQSKVLHHLHTVKGKPHHARALGDHGVEENHLMADAMTHLAYKLKWPHLFPDR